jgi:hypothetical protein
MAQFDNDFVSPKSSAPPESIPVVSKQISFSTADVERGLFYTPKHISTEYSTVVVVVLGNVLMAGGPIVSPPAITPPRGIEKETKGFTARPPLQP